MPSDKIMEVAEKLYNQGYISYPRTETDAFESGFPLKSLVERLVPLPRLGPYAQKLMDGAFRWPRSGKNNDKAHPPIHPTKEAADLSGAEAKVYEFIVRRFLACCSDDAKGAETIVLARIGDEEFRARGIIVEALNYLEIYTYESWTDQVIGSFAVNELLEPSRLELVEGTTTAPKLLSEPELIGTMDKNGIGTDATIHEHIKKIIERTYVVKNRESRFHPTNLGLALVLGYDQVGLEESLTKPKLRATLEANLMAICEGRARKEDVLREMISYFSSSLSSTQNNLQVLLSVLEQHGQHGLFHLAPLPETTGPAAPRTPRTRRTPRAAQGPARSDGGGDSDDEPFQGAPRVSASRSAHGRFGYPEENDDPNGAAPRCGCGSAASKKITKKPGPNCGRAFWGCTECNFFCWVGDERAEAKGSESAKENRNGGGNGNRNGNRGQVQVQVQGQLKGQNQDRNQGQSGDLRETTRVWQQDSTLPSSVCYCGEPVAHRVVAKEGPNKGREFLVCAKPKERGCSFFSWQDVSGDRTEPARAGSNGSGRRHVGRFDHQVKCHCDMIAARDETKGGADKGRIYYKCPKTIKKCKFFQWDEPSVGHALVPRLATEGGSNLSSITCYRCGQAGHFANACPDMTNPRGDGRRVSQRKRPLAYD